MDFRRVHLIQDAVAAWPPHGARTHDNIPRASRPRKASLIVGYAPTSTPSLSKRGVKSLQLYPRVGGCELPVGFGVFLVSFCFPGGDLRGQTFLIGNASVQAL